MQSQQVIHLTESGLPSKFSNSVAGNSSLTITYAINGIMTACTIYVLGVNTGFGAVILDTYTGLVGTTRTVQLNGVSYASFSVIAVYKGGISVKATLTLTGPGQTYTGGTAPANPDNSISINKSQTIPAGYNLILCTGGASGIVLGMPPLYQGMPPITFIKVDADSAGSVTISGTINGNSAGYVIENQWQQVTIGTDGTSLYVVGNN